MKAFKNYLWNFILLHFVLPKEMVKWVVNNYGELGVKIGNTCYYLYKGESFIYEKENTTFREVGKREFGESCISPEYKPVVCTEEEEREILEKAKKIKNILIEEEYQLYLKKIQVATENKLTYVPIGSGGIYEENLNKFREKGFKTDHVDSVLGIFSYLIW